MDSSSKQYYLKPTLEIPERRLFDVLTTAVEGGIAYWLHNGDFKNPHISRNQELDVTSIIFEGTGVIPQPQSERICFGHRILDDRQFVYIVYPFDLITGAQKILDEDKYGPIARAAALELTKGEDMDIDADAADCLVQVAAFGEVVYG